MFSSRFNIYRLIFREMLENVNSSMGIDCDEMVCTNGCHVTPTCKSYIQRSML